VNHPNELKFNNQTLLKLKDWVVNKNNTQHTWQLFLGADSCEMMNS